MVKINCQHSWMNSLWRMRMLLQWDLLSSQGLVNSFHFYWWFTSDWFIGSHQLSGAPTLATSLREVSRTTDTDNWPSLSAEKRLEAWSKNRNIQKQGRRKMKTNGKILKICLRKQTTSSFKIHQTDIRRIYISISNRFNNIDDRVV